MNNDSESKKRKKDSFFDKRMKNAIKAEERNRPAARLIYITIVVVIIWMLFKQIIYETIWEDILFLVVLILTGSTGVAFIVKKEMPSLYPVKGTSAIFIGVLVAGLFFYLALIHISRMIAMWW